MQGYMYILECTGGAYYTGSTIDLCRRLAQHQRGEGANFTRKRLPVKLVYVEVYQNIADAYKRERQIHGWRRAKKEALINGSPELLPLLAFCYSHLRKINLNELDDFQSLNEIDSLRSHLEG